ncbi:MAG: hypothetical protein MJY54_02915 [archaeon]|nr:hypothetical protein [archaeon]
MNISLDHTLGCGQAHRWIKKDNVWEGVLGKEIVTLIQTDSGFECDGTSSEDTVLDYFRAKDNLKNIYSDICEHDSYASTLIHKYPGMRILKQDCWECVATYILATNANIKRIRQMVNSVCIECGEDLGGRHSFPTPEEVIMKADKLSNCKLGYRKQRFIELAKKVSANDIDLNDIEKFSYEKCVQTLLQIRGIGPKVADCVSLFGYGHLDAFPIDARIKKILWTIYGKKGSYKQLSEFSREKFGKYAGYAQEFLYYSSSVTSAPSCKTDMSSSFV